MPATIPLSIIVLVPSVEDVSHLASYPIAPPESEPEIPRDVVETYASPLTDVEDACKI